MLIARAPSFQRLRKFATGNTASIAASVGATNVLRIVSSITLTRLLDSHAYGVVGVITSISYMLTMLSDVGMLGFIVRHSNGDDAAFRDEIWTIRLVRGAALSMVMVAIAHPAAGLLGKPELAPVIAVWSLSFLIDGLSSLAFATGVREQRLWRLSMLDLSSNVSSFVISVTAAIFLRSYWAIVMGMLGGASIKAVLSYIVFRPARRRFVFSRARSRELWAFSRYIAMSSALSLLIMQSDKLVLARLMPLATYGLYAIAVTLAAAPGALATPYATRVLYAVYSKVARTNRSALRKTLYDARRRVVLLYMFGVGGMIGVAPLLIALLYDPRYAGVTRFLQLIAISAVLRLPSLAANQALIAIGKTKSMLVANIGRLTWLAIGGAVALATGNIMLLIAIVGTVEVPALLCFWFNLRRAGLLNMREEGYGLAAAVAGVAIGWAVSSIMLSIFPAL